MHRETLIVSLDPSPHAVFVPRDTLLPSSVKDLPGEQTHITPRIHPRLETPTSVQECLSFAQ